MKKLIPDEENWKDKLTKFMGTKGFYIILVVCILFLAATAIFLTTQYSNTPETGLKSEEGVILPDEAKDVAQEEPTKAVSGTVEKNEPANKASTEKSSALAENSVAKTEDTKPKSEGEKSSAIKFERPVDGAIMKDFTRSIETFSESKTLGDIRAHSGIDFKAEKLAKVRAVTDGIITSVENNASGIVVEISHESSGLKTRYAGLSKQGLEDISVGLAVKANDVIGLVGDPIQIECEDGAHLHFEVIKNGKAVDPLEYLRTPSAANQDTNK